MKKKVKNNDKFRVKKSVIVVTFFLFVLLIGRLCYLCLVDYKVGEGTITAFIKNRNTEEEILMPKRGTIYDYNGNILANDVISYTLLAYLSDKRVDASGNKGYVEDFDYTSEKLAEILKVSKEDIKEKLENGRENNKYQIEFGTIGKGITEITKDEIVKLNLQGIDFIKNTKRYYPNGDFASYMLGYTVFKEDDKGSNWLTGEMGIEEYFNDDLKGKSGYRSYERDKYGYKIANGREYVEPEDNGNDIYLTMDSNIQLFIENAVKEAQSKSEAEWTLMVVMNAKTGAILGYSSTPSFDPNLRNMSSYLDPVVSLSYEPGSTMKIFSYMCAIESGKYSGSDTYESGSKSYTSENNGKVVTISDWNKIGWGKISYDKGFALSSNIAVANLVENVITKEELKDCFEKYGFGQKTGYTVSLEDAGSIDYEYQIEAAIAGYGQGITTTPMQHLQALTAIANDGVMLKPYIVDKIVDTDSGKTIYSGSRQEVRKVASSETVAKMKSLMASVINGDNTNSTGYTYYMDGYSLIGKTGTAQIYDYKKGHYMTGESDYIYSFSGLFPEEEAEIIIYTATKRPKDITNYLAPIVKEVEKNITKYLNIEEKIKDKEVYEIESFYNKNTLDVKNKLTDKGLKVIVLGEGSKIAEQYPNIGDKVYEDDLVIIKTNSSEKKMIDLTGYSYKEVINILKLMKIDYELEGSGYVYEQSIEEGEIVSEKVYIKLKERY